MSSGDWARQKRTVTFCLRVSFDGVWNLKDCGCVDMVNEGSEDLFNVLELQVKHRRATIGITNKAPPC